MQTRKEFLQSIFIHGARALDCLEEMQNGGPYRDADFIVLTELTPSLLKMEAERLGIDPDEGDRTALRARIYDALCQNCRRSETLSQP